ncbi:MAG: hypothetical protein ABIK53_08355 [bacterium]
MTKTMFRVFLCSVSLFLLLSSGCSKPAQDNASLSTQKKVNISTKKISEPKNREPVFVYNTHGRRDPFIPLISENKTVMAPTGWSFISSKLPEMKIEGVLFDEIKPLAIINDKIVAIGDSISNCKIVSITREEIVIRYMNKEYSVKMSGDKL